MAVQGWPRRLTWGDFRPIQQRPAGETEDAQIAPLIDSPSRATVVRDGDQVRLGSFTLVVRIDGRASWVVQGRNTPALLTHEQGHLDIAGLVAYENHRALEALRAPSTSALTQLVTQTQQRMKTKLDGLTDKYDTETDHSRNIAQQNTWNQLIARSISNNYQAPANP